MGLTARDKGGGYDPIPEDLHLAVCYAVYDLGTQYDERWSKSIHRSVIMWEIPSLRIQLERDGETKDLPRAISKRYTLSLHKKAELRKDLESWRGRKFGETELKGFDLKHLLGVSCQIQVLHNKVDDKVYANISAIIKAPPGIKLTSENPPQFFSFEEGQNLPKNAPEWVTDLIRQSLEWQGETGATASNDQGEPPEHDDSMIPF